MTATLSKLTLVVAILILAASPSAEAQQVAKVPYIGYMTTAALDSPEGRGWSTVFRDALRERGYIDGQNVVITYRSAEGRIERFPDIARELVGLKVDLIVAGPAAAGRAAQQATSTIPIVVVTMGDPVGDGFVQSLARPGGNVTGLTFLGPELVPKRLALLKEILPKGARVAVLDVPGAMSERAMRDVFRESEAAARSLGLHLQKIEVRAPDELDRAFSTMVKNRANAFLPSSGSMLFVERRRIVALAAKHRLPGIYAGREFVELGGLMAYGTSIDDLIRRSTIYVDKILKGAKPADLPIEQPTKFELVVNLKTAKALGLTIPSPLLARADQVLE